MGPRGSGAAPRRSAPPTGRIARLRRRQQRHQPADGPADALPADALPDGKVGRQPRETRPAAGTLAGPAVRRLRRSLTRPGRGQLIAALILFVVGVGGVMQVRANTADSAYSNARREDLIVLLDGLDAESRRLQGEITELERTRLSLQSGADTSRVAREESQGRVQELSILAGTVPAEGPGIRMRIADPRGLVSAEVLLDAVEEMRDAGAEVIEVNDTVRVVASTWFGRDASGLVIDGVAVSSPLTVDVIGDPQTLEEAAQFRGGIVSEITGPRIGGQVQLTRPSRVVVESLHTPRSNQYAQPASPPPTPR